MGLMVTRGGDRTVHPGWAATFMVGVVVIAIVVCLAQFYGTFRSFVAVTLVSDRSGLVMENGAKVKLRGVQVGRVSTINRSAQSVSLALELDPDKTSLIPSNVAARIRATTAFGAKYVDLIYPDRPSSTPLANGAVLQSQNVSTEVNTVFQNLVSILQRVDPAKLNAILTTFAEGLRGQGPAIGEATTNAAEVLTALNARGAILDRNWDSLRGFSDTFGAAAPDILTVLDAVSTTSDSVVRHAGDLDRLLLSVTGFAQSGIDTLAPSKDNLVTGINAAESTTSLLMKYNPSLTCILVGGKKILDPQSEGGYGFLDKTGGNGRTVVLDAALMLGDDPYRYPTNLPITGARGGPDGKPGCGSLPDVSQNWPVRELVTNTGFGTGLDWRPNPGIGFPGLANYFPVTKAIPEPARVRYPGGPAPGPIPYPAAPPYGAPLYGPDGTPLYPGLPPAPPPGLPREPGPPPPGSEPPVVPFPMGAQPIPAPPIHAVAPAP